MKTLVEQTTFSRDVLGRYVCNTFQEADASTDPNPRPDVERFEARPDARPFDFIVIGGGTFGAALAEHLWYRGIGTGHRILVLEGGPFFLPEHIQNLPVLHLAGAGATTINQLRTEGKFGIDKPRNEVWGLPWQSGLPFPGLAYCIGGRSLYWGGWSPELIDSELPTTKWPASVLTDLRAKTLPYGATGYFQQASDQIGVTETNDFIFGELHQALRDQLFSNIGSVTDAMPLGPLPDHPAVRFSPTALSEADLERMLGRSPSNPTPARQPLLDELKLEAPLAVQGQSGHAGFFPFNKFSTVPLLIKAAREAFVEAVGDDVKRRLMIVPYCHVNRLITEGQDDSVRVSAVDTNLGLVRVTEHAKVIIALGTIESTRLALDSFRALGQQRRDRIGKNLMAHLRSNLDVRIPRTALASLSPAIRALQASALFVKGQHKFSNAAGDVGHFHLQITASGLGAVGANSEAELFKKIPDIEKYDEHRHANDTHVVITIRGIGEMEPMNTNSHVTLDQNPNEHELGVQRAYVSVSPSQRDMKLWEAMDKASDGVAKLFANGHNIDIIVRGQVVALGVDPTKIAEALPYQKPDPNNPLKKVNNPDRRDGLGTTHHEAGTLWMGDNDDSVTDADGRFRGVKNAYAVGPALFPTIGSPNPMLTGIALARRMGDHLIPPPPAPPADPGFTYLFNGLSSQLQHWRMAGGGKFAVVSGALIAQPANELGLLYYSSQKFENFTLKLDFFVPRPRGGNNDNSGVFVRFRDPTKPVPDPQNPGVSHPYQNQAWVAVNTGYEVQIDDEARGDNQLNEPDGLFFNRTGAIYKIKNQGVAPGQQKYTQPPPLEPDRWHTYEIQVTDQEYVTRLDGQETTRFKRNGTDNHRGNPPSTDPDSGFVGIQAHSGRVAFANIRVKPT